MHTNTDTNLNKQISDAKEITTEEIQKIYESPLPDLIFKAQAVLRENFQADEVQMCTLLSVKTGGCKEDCAYCPQSARHNSDVNAHPLLDVDAILKSAQEAKAAGSSRFCMGAAWRTPPKKGVQFNQLLDAVKKVSSLGMEVCTTLGMIDEEQARQLADAGVTAYNHNLDTSPDFYEKIITTRTYQDRLDTLANVRKSGMSICCGGIVGLGESRTHRFGLLRELALMNPQPESVPINMLVKVEGTPLENEQDIDIFELIRTIATARILMPKSRVRLSAGREQMSEEAQALCFLAGANSIFSGEKLLTTPNPGEQKDAVLFEKLGLKSLEQSKLH